MARRWPRILLIWGMGVLAAAQLGKFAALIPVVRDDLGLSLAQAGWLVSLIETSGAVFGSVAGMIIGRLSSRKALTVGLALLTGACFAEAFTREFATLIAARLVASAGYLVIVIAGPSLITAVATTEERGLALALWSTFVPAGLAIGNSLTGGATFLLSWREILLAWAVVAAIALAASLRLPAGGANRSKGPTRANVGVWFLAAGFGCYTAFEVGVLALLPAYLAEQWGLMPSSAGAVAGAAAIATLLGSAAASRTVRQAGSRHAKKVALRVVGLGLLVPALLLFAAFPLPGARDLVGALGVCLLVVGLNAVSGLVPALTFARLPDLVHPTSNWLSDVAVANGVLTQLGAAGSLAGPPLLGLVASQWGWAFIAPAATVCSVLSFGFTVLAERQICASRRSCVP